MLPGCPGSVASSCTSGKLLGPQAACQGMPFFWPCGVQCKGSEEGFKVGVVGTATIYFTI